MHFQTWLIDNNEGAIQAENPQICRAPRNIIDSIIDDAEEEESDMNERQGEVKKADEVKKSSLKLRESESEPNDIMGETEPSMKVDKTRESESEPDDVVGEPETESEKKFDNKSETWEDIIVRRVAKQMQMKQTL